MNLAFAPHERPFGRRRRCGGWSNETPPYLDAVAERDFVRLKEDWLKRVMKNERLAHSCKVIAYFVADALNWATMDCWMSHEYVAKLVATSPKTVQRAFREFEQNRLMSVWRLAGSRQPLRYAPVYGAGADIVVQEGGHGRAEPVDATVHESSLDILIKPTLSAAEQGRGRKTRTLSFNPAERGSLELEVAALIGGFDALGRLSLVHEGIIDRLCEAQVSGSLDTRLIKATRLAANQVRGVWQ